MLEATDRGTVSTRPRLLPSADATVFTSLGGVCTASRSVRRKAGRFDLGDTRRRHHGFERAYFSLHLRQYRAPDRHLKRLRVRFAIPFAIMTRHAPDEVRGLRRTISFQRWHPLCTQVTHQLTCLR